MQVKRERTMDSGLEQLDSRRFMRLVEASRVLNSTGELSELLDFIISEAAALTNAEGASLLLLDPDTRELRFKATSNKPQGNLMDLAVPLDKSVAGTVFRTNEPLIIEDASSHPRWNSLVDRAIGFQTHSILGVPMHDVSGETVGVLEAVNKQGGSFTPKDVETLSTLADLAGVAVERARLIDELKQAYRQLNELDQLKSEFIALASHELRTPLSIILGYVTFLREETESPATANQLDRVLKAAVRLRSLIQDMLNLQYVETDKHRLTMETFNFVNIVRDVVTERDETSYAKQLTVSLYLPEERLPIFGDQGAMEVIVSNLLNNAIKFTPEGGEIDVILNRRGDEAWLEVRDTGIGIPAEQLSRIFTRFYQVEHHLDRHHEGLGLGLAIAKDLLEAQGGRIWAKSHVGEGSQFFVAMPLVGENGD